MRRAVVLLAVLAVVGFFAASAQAADKEVTLKGKITCARCMLKLKGISKCTTCIQVKEGNKNVVYLFLDRGSKETWHEEVCGGGEKAGQVTGVVVVKDGQKWIKPREVKYVK